MNAHPDPPDRATEKAAWLPVRLTRASDEIVGQLRAALFEGRLQPGEPLGSETDLAARFGVSRASVREAMRTLEASGIVEISMGPRGGARIARGDPGRFAQALAVQLRLVGVSGIELLDVRLAIEWMGARLAATNATPADLHHLGELMRQSTQARSDPARFDGISREFHAALAEASHNRALVAALTSIREALQIHRMRTVEAAERILSLHQSIYDAVVEHDAERACELVRQDLQRQRAAEEARQAQNTANPLAGD